MTKSELIAELVKLATARDDPVFGHRNADNLLVQYINDPDISAAYGNITKWYD